MKKNYDKVTIEGKDYVPFDSVQEAKGPVKIVIFTERWVFIGRYTEETCEEEGEFLLKNASCIRFWGTTDGLAQLVNGPTTETILDKCPGVFKGFKNQVIAMIDCNEDKWAGKL